MPYKHAGSVHAFDKEMALQNARDTYSRRGEGRSIWVVLADAIIDYRRQFGPVKRPEDLLNVSGIGSATLDRLRPLIFVP